MTAGTVLMLMGNNLDLSHHTREVTAAEGRRLVKVKALHKFK